LATLLKKLAYNNKDKQQKTKEINIRKPKQPNSLVTFYTSPTTNDWVYCTVLLMQPVKSHQTHIQPWHIEV